MVTKGAWTGMPIYSLTLEERATCPQSCHHWSSCYGNGMPAAIRYQHGLKLEPAIERNLRQLQRKHPGGFVIRLHVLGDFMSTAYLDAWAHWFDQFPALRVFGYTAWQPDTTIGAAVAELSNRRWDRFAIRLSSPTPGRQRAVTLWSAEPRNDVILCPVQTGKTRSCGSCAVCWSPAARDKTIAFLAHGR